MKQEFINLGKKIVPHDIRIFFRKLNWKRHYIQQSLLGGHPGEKVFCPIAKKEFKTFIKINNDLVTPSNGARKRHRLVWHFLENELKILKGHSKILHIAPELPFYEILSKQKGLTYVPGDKMVAGYSNQKGILNVDLTALEFENDMFDYVLCNHVLEHIPDDGKAMSEIFRVLKPGGKAIITVPINEKLSETYEDSTITSPKDREKHFGQWDHVRWYATDIKSRLEKYGFEVDMNRYGKGFTESDFQRFGFGNDIIVVAKKGSNK